MNTHADKTQEQKSQIVTNDDSKKQDKGEALLRFADNRPEAIAQRKLKNITAKNPRKLHANPIQTKQIQSPGTAKKPLIQKADVNDDMSLTKEEDDLGTDSALTNSRENGRTSATVPSDFPVQRNALYDNNRPKQQTTSTTTQAPIQRSPKGAAAGAAIGAGLGAFGFFAGPIVGGITTAVGAIIGAIVGHVTTGSKLPKGAYARKDKTLTPVKQSELNAILEGAVEDNAITTELSKLLSATGAALIGKELLFWTEGASPHCEVLISDEKADTYRVNVVAVLPKESSTAYKYFEGETGAKLARGAAIHELVHALEVMTQIGGIENLGEEVPKVKENDRVLKGRELQWSKIPEDVTAGYIDELMKLMLEQKAYVKEHKQEEFSWDYYTERLKYGQENRHEIPTVIVQIIHDVDSWDDYDKLKDTKFYHRLLEVRQALIDAL